jgi:hypothetical protein
VSYETASRNRGSYDDLVTLPKLLMTVMAAAAFVLPAAAQTPRNGDGTPQTESQFVAARVYRALIGREAESEALAQLAADIEQGRLRQRVNAIVISQEFRSHIYGLAPDQILAGIYQGMLDHDPDASAAGWQRMISMAKYADVIAGIIATPEFKAKLAPFSAAAAAPPAGTAAGEVPPSVTCQEDVVEAIRRDLGGVVFIRFDAATVDGATITGAATDVNGGGRRLSYRCDPAATYKYDDGGRERHVAPGADFASDVVRACLADIRLKAQQEHGVARLVFQSAGLMTGGADSHLVRGLASEVMASVSAGSTYLYSCDMDGTQVTASSIRSR